MTEEKLNVLLTEEQKELLSMVDAIVEEHKALKNKVIELEVELFSVREGYKYSNIVSSAQFRAKKTLLACGSYDTLPLLPLIEKYGYNNINNRFVEIVEKMEKQEAVDRASEKAKGEGK